MKLNAERSAFIDVTRAVALIGVIVMNYHGFLNQPWPNKTLAERIFNPATGILTTRFAATFVLVAGVGIALLTNKSRLTKHDRAIVRWQLLRRGVALYSLGYVIDWIWPGTILFYYGAMFIIASLIFNMRSRLVGLVAALSMIAATAISIWRLEVLYNDGNATIWLSPESPNSPRNLLISTFVHGNHPLLPCLAFLLVGILIGRNIELFIALRKRTMVNCAMIIALCYGLTNINLFDSDTTRGEMRNKVLTSTNPLEHGLLYSISTLATAVFALAFFATICQNRNENKIVIAFQAIGQMTLTLYLAHIFIFNAVVDWLGWVRPTGLDTALVLAAVVYLLLALTALWWKLFIGTGPAEFLYRKFSS